MNTKTKIYRKRLIPQETIYLKDDTLIMCNNNTIITSWNSLKPRCDIARGISLYLLDDGYKISKVYDINDNVVYWYVDIITSDYSNENNSLLVTDLLVDLLIYEDGSYKVVDLDEVADALEQGLLSTEMVCDIVRLTNHLLNKLYQGNFTYYQHIINQAEHNYKATTNSEQ